MAASIRSYSPETVLGLVMGADGALAAEAERVGLRVISLNLGDSLDQVGDSAIVAHGPSALVGVARRLAGAALESLKYVDKLRKVVAEFDPSVVHSNGIKMHLLGAASRNSAPLIWHIHDFIGERPVVSRAMRACGGRANAAIVNSAAVARDARRLFPRLPSTVIFNAVDTRMFAPAGDTVDLDSLGGSGPISPSPVRVGLVATYARWKGHDVFLEAARIAQRAPHWPEVRFYVVGGPIYATAASQYAEAELRDRARQLGVEGSVSFIPFQHRIDAVYRALDIVVHASSRPEPFGRTIVEGMATGKAVIVTRGGGATELFTPGVDAVGVPPRDAHALADAICELARDAPMRGRLGKAARSSALDRFSRERLAGQVFEAYRAAGVVIGRSSGKGSELKSHGNAADSL
jgi:glycosyltransferase involved in cell wall biosynthesis